MDFIQKVRTNNNSVFRDEIKAKNRWFSRENISSIDRHYIANTSSDKIYHTRDLAEFSVLTRSLPVAISSNPLESAFEAVESKLSQLIEISPFIGDFEDAIFCWEMIKDLARIGARQNG